MSELEPLQMKIELTVIEDLGIKLYGKLPPVISEIIANAWDADAVSVEISIPEGKIDESSMIRIEDVGMGMSYKEIITKYLRIGRKKREEEETDKTPNGRSVMGSKGIGKLSVFGVSKIVEVETVKNHVMNSFRMNIDDILKDARNTGIYKPQVLETNKDVTKERGTVVILRNLKRKTMISSDSIKRDVARHFAIIDEKFKVSINGERITKVDKYNKERMSELWEFEDEIIDKENPEWKVSGWIGTTETPLDEVDRGVVVMARGKLLQAPTTFEAKVGEKYSYSYLVGEVHAEFLDTGEDLIATNRQSLVWESPQGTALREWGKQTLKKIAKEWDEKRRVKKERVIREEPEFKEWLEKLRGPEKNVADKVIRVIAGTELIDDERRKELARYMMESFDQQVFQVMVNNLGENPRDVEVIEVFQEWDVIEAREILRMVKGRLISIERLEKLVDSEAREIPTLHEFFRKWPWILDPTWTRWQDEVRYSEILKKKFPDQKLDEPDRRIDFVCIGIGDTINIIELKKPAYSVKANDFDQLIDYQEFVRENLGSDVKRGYNDVAGYLIAGKMQNDRVTQRRKKESENSRIYVRRYEDLIVTARQLHAEFKEKLNQFSSALDK